MAGSDDRSGGSDGASVRFRSTEPPAPTSEAMHDAEAAISAVANRRRAQPLDEDLLDELAGLLGELPEPLAAVAVDVEVARAEGDSTGVRKRLFELGIAVVRYALSAGLAMLAAKLDGAAAPRPLAQTLARAARMSDGHWCAVTREVAKALRGLDAAGAKLLGFVNGKTLTALVRARNDFVHGSGTGDDSLPLVLRLMTEAEPLWSVPLVVVATVDPPAAQSRSGVPLRPGVWRKRKRVLPAGLEEGAAYLCRAEHWTRVDPWLPDNEGRLLLIDAPHASGTSWRSIDIESGEHRAAPALDAAVRALTGAGCSAPVPPTDQPKLVGRDAALNILRQAGERATKGGLITVVLVTGPQGIGRGRLLSALGDAAAAFDFAPPIEAVCLQQRRGMLRPLRRAVRDRAGLEELAEVLGEAMKGDALGGAERLEAVIEAVEEALIEASHSEPQLLLLDDAQWADDSTVELLSMLTERATRKGRGRLLVLVAVRDEPGQSAALTRFIGQVERDVGLGATRLALEPLATKEATSLLDSVAPMVAPLRQLLLREAGGVPFFLVQPVLAWTETGSLQWQDGVWHPLDEALLERPVPGVAELVRARLSSFFEPASRGERFAEQILLSLALAGGWLPQAQLRSVLAELGCDASDLELALEALLDAHLVTRRAEPQEYGFAQAMVQRAVLRDLSNKPYKPRVLTALLETLAGEPSAEDDAAFIADGYLTLGNVATSQAWRARAIGNAMALGRFKAALRQAERLLALARNDHERSEALLAQADAQLRAGNAVAGRQVLAKMEAHLRRAPRVDVRARILEVIASESAIDEAQAEALIEASDAIGDTALSIETRLAAARSIRGGVGIGYTGDARDRLAAEASAELRYRVLALRWELLHDTRALDDPECMATIEQARLAAAASGSAWARLDAANDSAIVATTRGEHELATGMLETIAADAAKAHFGRLRRGALASLATIQLRAGRHEEAARRAELAAIAATSAGDNHCLAIARSVQAGALQPLGRYEEALLAIDEAIDLKLDADDPNAAIALLRRADLRLEQGEHAAALEDATWARQHAERYDNADHIARARIFCTLAEVETGVTSETVAATIASELSRTATTLRGPTRQALERLRQRVERS